MDFTKTFNKVLHGKLLCDVRYHGISGEIASWMYNLLYGRKYRFMVKCFFNWRTTTSSMHLGSELGPLLCVICINNLDENVHGTVSTFTDDTKTGGIIASERGC